MHEVPTAHLHFDPPFPGLVGGSILQGWLVGKPGHHYTDVRTRVGTQVFPGIHGVPRRDLAEFFRSPKRHLLAGFSITMVLPAGRHRVELDALDVTGEWRHIDGLDWDVTSAEAKPDDLERAPLNADGFGEALRILLRRLAVPGADVAALARALIAETPARHHLQHPPRPFHGHLDQPRSWERSLFGRLPISGWIYHESQPIQRVLVTTDLQAVQEMRLGRATAFLGARSGNSPLATHCGYDGFLDLPAQLPKPVAVRVYAELADGSWHLGSVGRFNETDQEHLKQPYAPFSFLRFAGAYRALAREVLARGWQLPAGRLAVVRQVWAEFSAQAPRRRSAPRAAAATARPVRSTPLIHLITHNLNREGAPLFLLEYARQLRAASNVSLAVTSAADGVLGREFAALGARVNVVDAAPVLATPDARGVRQALANLARRVRLDDASLVVANTLSAWWGVHLARAAGVPSLFYIHESTSPNGFFRGLLPAPALAVVEESFRLADRVSFRTDTTRAYYRALSDGANYRLNPGWIDLTAIDAFRAAHPRDALRRQLGLDPQRPLVVNVGTVCERKGQHLFARAVDLLWERTPALAAGADFLMIGGRDTPYDRDLAAFLTQLGRPNLRVLPETHAVYDYYGAADLFACSSYEESFPRVVLEAMAFELAIASTGVHGIPEMARPDQEALLTPAGDSAALALALERLLAGPDLRTQLTSRARERVREFDLRAVLPRHLALARELAQF